LRVLDIKEAEQKISSGAEPDFFKKKESIASALNWYSYYRDYKDSKKYTIAYMTENSYDKKDIGFVSKVMPESNFSNVGFVCRLTERHFDLELHQKIWLHDRIQYLVAIGKSIVEESTKQANEPKEDKPNIQDRVQEQTNEMIGELEGFIDNYKESFNAYAWMSENGVKAVHARRILDWFNYRMKEPQAVLGGKVDEELKEAYSHFTKAELKKYITAIYSIVLDANKIIHHSKAIRKPRAKKVKPVDKLVAKVQYKKEDTEFKLVSINPVEIVGAKQLWVFNTKTRKLGVYHASTLDGLTVKGTTIDGYTDTSFSKTLRKPADIFLAVQKGTERKYKSIFDGIKATEQPLTGRLNTDTILLKVFK
jgi:hypothetical protein